MRTPESPKTLYDKIFDEHVVRMEEDGTATLYIDRHLVHEVTSAQAFEGLRMNNRPLWLQELDCGHSRSQHTDDRLGSRNGGHY